MNFELPPSMLRLDPGLFGAGEVIGVVGSGRIGFALTSPLDCNVYLIVSGGEAVLVDAGSGLATEEIVASISSLQSTTRFDLRRIFLTHSHADHSAGAAGLKAALGPDIAAPKVSAAALRRGDRDASVFTAAVQAGSYPPEFDYPAIPVDVEVSDGDCFSFGDLTLEAIAAPGHAYDHTVYLLRAKGGPPPALFAGDLLLSDGRVLIQASWDCRLDEYAATIERLDRLGIGALLPGHGTFLCGGGAYVIERVRRQFATLVPPPHLA